MDDWNKTKMDKKIGRKLAKLTELDHQMIP